MAEVVRELISCDDYFTDDCHLVRVVHAENGGWIVEDVATEDRRYLSSAELVLRWKPVEGVPE